MMDSLIRITDGITFQDLKEGKISKIEIYERQINNWFIKSAEILYESSKIPNNYELEISLLTLLITFFESHGQYLLGDSSSRQGSRKVFEHGFKVFLEYLVKIRNHSEQIYDKVDINKFYTLVRCGLLHNSYINTGEISFLIDRYKMDKTHVLYPNRVIIGNWLINTENLLKEIKGYLKYYINLVENNDEIRIKFENMFDSFFRI